MARKTSKPDGEMKSKANEKRIWRKPWLYVVFVFALVLLALLAYQIPAVRYRVDTLISRIDRKINPPEASVFNPSQQGTIEAIISKTQTAAPPPATDEPIVQSDETANVSLTDISPEQSTVAPTLEQATPSNTPYPVPASYTINGMGLEFQSFNNCGPANLSMNLNFWAWQTNQEEMRLTLRTHELDRNVMLSEMADYVNTNTGTLRALLRYGGDLQVLKALVSGGFPVLLERGHTDPQDGWMGHYSIIHAYDDSTQTVSSNDTLLSTITLNYDELLLDWRHFDGIYIVIYPSDREQELLERLGVHADAQENLRLSLEAVEARIPFETGRELFFAWYSKGQLLVEMGDYLGAAQAFDQAFGIYSELDMGLRPWRMTWYQIGPYLAYYYSGRYQDTLNLATQTINNVTRSEPALPESFYWAGKASSGLGQVDEARYYFNRALEYHPNWQVVLDALATLP